MRVQEVMDRLAAIFEDTTVFPTIKAVYAGRPDDAPPANLPAVVIMSGDANYEYSGDSSNIDTLAIVRNYRILLLVANWLDDLEFEAEKDCRPYFAQVINRLTGCYGIEHPKGLNPLPFIKDAGLIKDSGVINIILAGVPYAGIEFQYEVLEINPIEAV